MADKSRCQKQTHVLVAEGVDSGAEVVEEAVDLEDEEVAAMARGIKVEEEVVAMAEARTVMVTEAVEAMVTLVAILMADLEVMETMANKGSDW